jgi:hypothetical protein
VGLEHAPYLVTSDAHDATVEAWSTARLPFEPKGWLLELRADLRTALKRLRPRDGMVLSALYGSPIRGYCDAENILVYNVGAGHVSAAAVSRLRVERSFRSPIPPVDLNGAAEQYWRYSHVPIEEPFAAWRDERMRGAGFNLQIVNGHTEPGIWVAPANVAGEDILIPVDLIVPEAAASGGGTRGARLGAHGKRAARRAVGLEAALVDHSLMRVAALDPADTRPVSVEVAGSAALLVAKAHKLHDRIASGKAERIDDKDAYAERLLKAARS